MQIRSFKRGKEVGFLPKPISDEKAYTSEALTSSLGLYKQKFPDAAAADVADDFLTSMEQVRFCTSCFTSTVSAVHLYIHRFYKYFIKLRWCSVVFDLPSMIINALIITIIKTLSSS